MVLDKQTEKLKGGVLRLDLESNPNGGDVTFSPDYTVTSTTDGGGRVLTNVEVILCFWGSFWSTTPPPSPSSDDYKTAIEGILSGPFMGGLEQYRGVGQGTLIYSEINDSSDPTNGYTDSDVVTMLKDRLNNTSMPAPTAGHNRFYAVILPKGVNNSLTQLAGQHQSFTYNGVTAYYAWVDNTGSLTGHDCVTKVFSHELVEACTNPDIDTSNNGILVDGTKPDGTSVTNDEIGDTCNDQFATADMNGVQCSVQSYWSKADNTCILPLGTATFWVDKSTFGKDEVQDVNTTNGGLWEKAFWIVVEGFSKNTFSSLDVSVPVPTGPFANIPGVTITQNADIDYENGVDPSAQQRIRIPFDITFTTVSLASFPSSGSQTYELDAFIATHGNKVAGSDASTEFELVAGADPYFTNINPDQNNVYYLSQDLRVFTATPAQNQTPVTGGPTFSEDSVNGAFNYIQQLLTWLNDPNNHFTDGSNDPFASGVIPQQSGALQGDSSVTPFTFDLSNIFNIKIYNNYNFALARVRLRGPAGEADNVRVFFRLWSTQTADADYQTSTYPSTPDAMNLPGSPLVGTDHDTLPFFATGNLSSNTDYDSGGANTQNIEIATGNDSIWAYYGCFLNLYDVNNVIDGKPVQAWLNGTHHCLVAQIAYDGAPVISGESPENSDKLAQRNLQITLSDNPGPAATHRIPQTFDIRPSALAGALIYPDELMIDWGAIPPGSVASIYWPQVLASDVLALAAQRNSNQALTAADAHTIQCKITSGVTYIPIPTGAGENFAGLLTVDLPPGVVTGQEFNIVVRRVGTNFRPIIDERGVKVGEPEIGRVASILPGSWRYVIGTFQVKIPVSTREVMLLPEENTLAIMKWRLQQLSPGNRWYPVLVRYIDYLSGRVDGLGGNASTIQPSPSGIQPGPISEKQREVTGKVVGIIYDHFGDFDGFLLSTEHDKERLFKSRESDMEEIIRFAWQQRVLITVITEPQDQHRPLSIMLRHAPKPRH